ncbi:uncharacterized protein LOC143281849 [Babylonia areolata]|uniref:uncharacterized protein LOC143281849 n=1 Tax=Babylonia areolata TaxID=304850 RepID=UPI003FD4DA68
MVARRLLRRAATLTLCLAAFTVLYVGWSTSRPAVKGRRKLLHSKQAPVEEPPRQAEWRPGLKQEEAPPDPASQEERVRQRFKDRLTCLRKACGLYYNTSVFRSKAAGFHHVPIYRPVMNVSIRYCPIAKTAATTWTHYLYSIKNHMASIGMKGVDDQASADDQILFTFVREPYARMLSGYVDKLLTPNTLFWRIVGRVTVGLFRPHPSKKSLQCGHDITFPEFVKYVVYSQMHGKHLNGHFIPTHDQCDMCTLPYRYIGHLETIKEDMPFIIKAIQSPVNYTKTYDRDTIVQNAKMVLWDKENRVDDVLKCMDLDEASRRLWKKFQIRGLISKTEKFPIKHTRALNITLNQFVRAALAAHQRSQKNPRLKEQRVEALREAFAQVPLADRLYAQHVLFLDFQMFGFDPMLKDVFPDTPYVPDKSFSYFDIHK